MTLPDDAAPDRTAAPDSTLAPDSGDSIAVPAVPAATGDAAGPTGTGPVRAVFRTALRDMLVLLAVLAVLGVAIGALVAGTPGVWGALIGVGMTLLFSGTTVLTMLRTAESSATTTAAVVMGGWLAKMAALIALFAVLKDMTFYDRPVLVVVLLAGVLGSAALDYRAVQRGRIPYVNPGADAA